jgi:hypothetical protein
VGRSPNQGRSPIFKIQRAAGLSPASHPAAEPGLCSIPAFDFFPLLHYPQRTDFSRTRSAPALPGCSALSQLSISSRTYTIPSEPIFSNPISTGFAAGVLVLYPGFAQKVLNLSGYSVEKKYFSRKDAKRNLKPRSALRLCAFAGDIFHRIKHFLCKALYPSFRFLPHLTIPSELIFLEPDQHRLCRRMCGGAQPRRSLPQTKSQLALEKIGAILRPSRPENLPKRNRRISPNQILVRAAAALTASLTRSALTPWRVVAKCVCLFLFGIIRTAFPYPLDLCARGL